MSQSSFALLATLAPLLIAGSAPAEEPAAPAPLRAATVEIAVNLATQAAVESEEAVEGEEVEVFFEEEVSSDELAFVPLPEYHFDGRLLALPVLCLFLLAWNVGWRSNKKRLGTYHRARAKQRKGLVTSLLALAFLLSNADAEAAKYMSLGQAVKTYMPSGAKIFKVTKTLSGADKSRLVKDYGWKPTEDAYKFYVGKKGDEAVAYVFIVPEIFNTCFHKYAVGMDATGRVVDTAIIELSCPRSFPINRQSFLSQFKEKRHRDALTTGHDIDAVTGATLSSEATATATRKAVSLHNLFFGGGESVAVSKAVAAARAEANDMIETAIETGETLGEAAQIPEKSK